MLENTPTTAFNGTVDDTVLHSLTGLVWDRCSLGQIWNAGACTASATAYNWQNALKEVQLHNDANHLGHSDWRLPNRDELHSIVENCGTEPTINQAIFPNTSMLNYWSASSDAVGTGAAWIVHFGHSGTLTFSKTNSYNVRLVRGGRSYDATDLLDVRVATSTSLNASPVSPATFGDAVTLTAIVTGSTTPTGTIQFYEGSNVQTCDAGNQTLSAGSATCILTALPAGSYNFSADYPGDSENMSSSSDALAYAIDSGPPPPTVPDAPVIVSGTPANTGALIAFTPPVVNGGAEILDYTAVCNGGSDAVGAASPLLVSGLINGSTYECYVYARNSVGTGALSGSVMVTPTDGGDVTLPPADGGPGEVVTFTHTATSLDGGDPVTATLEVVATNPLPAEAPPAEAESLVAAIDISSTGSVAGYQVAVTFTIEAPSINEFTGFWKYGKETAIDTPHWYDYGTLEANGDGTGYELSDDKKTLTVYLVDGLRGDDDLLVNASIVDPALPIVEVSSTVFSNGFE